jgi:hypothetical protein
VTATTRAQYVPARINHTLAAYDWAISGICGDLAEHRIDRAMAVVLLTMETEETAAELTRLERFAAQADGVTS